MHDVILASPPEVLENEHGSLVWRKAGGGTIEVVDINVVDRRKGHGTALVQALVDMPRYGCIWFPLWAFTRQSNRIAQQFWESLGFKKVAEVVGFYSEGGAHGDAILYHRVVCPGDKLR